ncbi:MAG: preprotein translocase subunit YajC [Maribacter sp.]|jgi:preprotein translocase subunit YajC
MGDIGQFLPMILIFVVAYFFMIRPQMKRQKDEKKFSAELKRGDRVITKSGLHGKVVDINDKDLSCVLETMAGKLKFDRSAISMEMSKKLSVPVLEKK